jgi:hypothetical protein
MLSRKVISRPEFQFFQNTCLVHKADVALYFLAPGIEKIWVGII